MYAVMTHEIGISYDTNEGLHVNTAD